MERKFTTNVYELLKISLYFLIFWEIKWVRGHWMFRQACALLQVKKEGKDKELIQSSTTPDPRHHRGKWHNHKETSHTREPRGPPFHSRWSNDCKEQTRQYNRDEREKQMKKDPQKKYHLGTVSKILKGLYQLHP